MAERTGDPETMGRPTCVLVVAGRPHPITGPVITIGRSGRGVVPDIDVGESDPEMLVSRRHAELHSAAGRMWIVDVGSANGTAVDGVPIAPGEPVPVRPGSIVTVADVVLRVQEDSVRGTTSRQTTTASGSNVATRADAPLAGTPLRDGEVPAAWESARVDLEPRRRTDPRETTFAGDGSIADPDVDPDVAPRPAVDPWMRRILHRHSPTRTVERRPGD